MVASLDTSFGQFAADALLVALVAVNVYLGWRFGLMRRMLALGGLYLACLAATSVGNPVAAAVRSGSVEANAWSFVAVFALVVVGVEVIGFLFHSQLQWLAKLFFDRVAGAVSGAFVGLAQALVLFLVAYGLAATPTIAAGAKATRAAAADAIQSATLSGQAVRISPQVHALLAPVLPRDMAGHLTQGTSPGSA